MSQKWTINFQKFSTLFFRSYHYPRVSGVARQEKCEDPEYQRNPKNSHIYGNRNRSDPITPVNTYYPPATVCYVDKSGGWQCIILSNYIDLIPDAFNNTSSLGSCPEFGVSGSGIVREWKQRYWIDDNGVKRPENGPNYDYPNNSNSEPQYQYSFVGPLSMSKGCDLTADFKRNRDLQDRAEYLSNIPEFIYRGTF